MTDIRLETVFENWKGDACTAYRQNQTSKHTDKYNNSNLMLSQKNGKRSQSIYSGLSR
jgi:hypothetical protein